MTSQPFTPGEIVLTRYYRGEEYITRTVTSVKRDKRFSSGWGVKADGGEKCACCGKPVGTPILGEIDSGNFRKPEFL